MLKATKITIRKVTCPNMLLTIPLKVMIDHQKGGIPRKNVFVKIRDIEMTHETRDRPQDLGMLVEVIMMEILVIIIMIRDITTLSS